MDRYGVGGATAATAASTEQAIVTLWNPSAAKNIYVRQIQIFQVAATAGIPQIRRASARGTVTTSFTPGIEHHFDHGLASAAGVILDTVWSVQPTFAGTAGKGILTANVPAAIGAGYVWTFFDVPIVVKAGAGLSLVARAASYPIAEAAFVWDE